MISRGSRLAAGLMLAIFAVGCGETSTPPAQPAATPAPPTPPGMPTAAGTSAIPPVPSGGEQPNVLPPTPTSR